MDVLRARLVLDERERVLHLADVVVVGRDARQERIRADRLGRALGEVADHHAVVVRPRRLEQEPAQEPVRRVRQLEHLEHGHDPEQVAEDGEAARPRATTDRIGVDERPPVSWATAARSRWLEQAERRDHDDVRRGEDGEDADERVEPLGARHRQQRGQAAGEDVDGELERVAVHDAGEDGERPAIAAPRPALEQDPHEEHRRRGRDDERPQRPIGRDPHRHGRRHEARKKSSTDRLRCQISGSKRHR